MNFTKTDMHALQQIFAGSLCFILLLCIAPFCVAFIFPQSIITDKNDILPVSDLSNLESSLVVGKPIEYAISPPQINEKIANTEMQDDIEEHDQVLSQNAIVDFYENITGNSDVTLAILTYADTYEIPLTLAFALAYSESRYKVTAVNGNTNESIDRGLFQLNSNSFPTLTEEEFFDPYTSAKKGLSFLRYCLDIGGNEITALAMYNAGTNRVRANGTPQTTLRHIHNIVTYQKGLEDLFDIEKATSQNAPKNFFALAPTAK